MSLFISLHLIAAVIWVGGMFFAYMVLRPVAGSLLPPPERLQLWSLCFDRFFLWVWVAIGTILASGYFMLFSTYGSFADAPLFIIAMHWFGIVMMVIFLHVFFAPYKRLKIAVQEGNWQVAASKLAQIRILIAINLVIGLSIFVIVSFGRTYFQTNALL
ncbi:MAG: CopD family protein [Gammaproteobacteria bacterium]